MKFIKTILPILILISGCSSNQTFHIKTDDAKGIENNSPLQCNGVTVGRLTDIVFNKETMVVLQLEIDEGFAIPKDSKFQLESRDFLGTMAINLQLGSANKLLSPSDTLLAQGENNNVRDTIASKLSDAIISLYGKAKQDSILNRLNKLQTKLDSLKNDCHE